MSGRNAKTNFPVPRTATGELAPVPPAGRATGTAGGSSSSSGAGNGNTNSLSQILSAKLRKCCKTPSPSLTCLRLDPEKSHIGVWQKRAGARADSSWVMTVQLNKQDSGEEQQPAATTPTSTSTVTTAGSPSASVSAPASTMMMDDDEEERIALQMIEELLGRSSPVSHSHAMLQAGEGSIVI